MPSKKHYIPGVTKVGTLSYPKISKPDSKGEFADGKYKTDFVLEPEDAKALKADITAKAKEIFPGATKMELPFKVKDGEIIFRFKGSKKPVIVDAKRQRLPEGVTVRGGSKARISYTLFNWEKGAKKGVSLIPDAVQITELAEGSPGARAFDEVEGGFDGSSLDPADYAESPGEEAFGEEPPPPSSEDDYDL